MELYLYGSSHIAPSAHTDESGKKSAAEPDYTGIIAPMQLRRMSKAVRLGIAASKACLSDAGTESPDAITLGTAMGCLADTEFFLGKMISQDEQMLTPTSFIQSTHNTVSGQIALLLKCHGHNLTFVQRGHSFEHAATDAMLYAQSHPEHTVLLGGLDELTANSLLLLQEMDVNGATEATAAAEGAAFFAAGAKPKTGAWKVTALDILRINDANELCERTKMLLEKNEVNLQPDFVLLGNNGNAFGQALYAPLRDYFATIERVADFKNTTGEYATAAALALSMLLQAAKNNTDLFGHSTSGIKRVVLVNNYMRHAAIWLLDAV